MTNLHQLLVERRSIRKYKEQPLDPEVVKTILEAGLLSPTGKNARAWHFIAVEDKAMLLRLSECKAAGALPVAKSALTVCVAVDVTDSETWIEDGAIAAAYMMLQARDLGVGSCWIEVNGRLAADGTPAEDVVSELLGLPEQIQPLCLVSMGIPDEERKPQNTEKLLWDHVHCDSFRSSSC
ncbi:MAG: nitroreductase family protein [Bacteroides sp.]|nr:nitroreductase family protein [Bacteroides sp.]MCM1378844.1 nitroreductase family protein [Bacteroides sp.]MCM1445461.1 nitroreductase family protein [Prevotella sp.]